MGISEYIILNCENCKKPVAKIHSELLARIKKALHYDETHGPHLYHVSCPGGLEVTRELTDSAMKIDKAIENLKADLLRPGSVDKLDFQDAEQLGIEAMEYIKRSRTFGEYPVCQQLPGETT